MKRDTKNNQYHGVKNDNGPPIIYNTAEIVKANFRPNLREIMYGITNECYLYLLSVNKM